MSSKPGIPVSSIYCFGSGEFGQTTQTIDTNSPVLALKDMNIINIYAGSWNSAALTTDGDLMAWGRIDSVKSTNQTANLYDETKDENNTNGNLPPSFNQVPILAQSSVKSVALNDYHTIAINQQEFIHFPTFDNQLISISNATDVFSRYKSVIIFKKETIYFYSPLKGIPNEFQLPHPEIPIKAEITQNGFAILSDNQTLRIYTEKESDSPIIINDVISVSASNDKYILLKPNGRIYTTCSNGGLVQIYGISGNPISVFAGGAHYGCVTFEGDCWTWGIGVKGQLGTASFTNSIRPKKVILKEGMKVISAAAGEEHTVLLTVKDTFFVPTLPDPMKKNEYMKMIRMDAAIPGAFVASEYDSKF